MSRRIIIDELEFEVPYGKLAAKSWHEETDNCKRVLFLHGWMDNAGSFDNMMPLLEHRDGLYIVALDLPGHGKSSQLPPGSSYSDMNIVMEIRRCVTELGWAQPQIRDRGYMSPNSSYGSLLNLENGNTIEKRKFTIVGHSLGAGLGLFYSSLYPDEIDEVILLDFLKSRTMSAEKLLTHISDTIDQFITVVPSQSPFASPIITKSNQSQVSGQSKSPDKGQVVVSQEAAIIATIDAHKSLGELTRDDAACLLRRSTVAVSFPPNSVIYSRDLRLQTMLNFREHWDINKVMFSKVKCNVISILANRGIYAEEELFRDNMDSMEEFMKARAKTFHVRWIDGDHYLHMNRPKETAEMINKYLDSPEDFINIET